VDKQGPFRQLLVGSNGRGLLLLSPRCCAVAATPPLDAPWPPPPSPTEAGSGAEQQAEVVRAVLLEPPAGVSIVKALWHPLSDAHVGVLLSDGTFELLNLSHRASLAEPEVRLQATFGGECEVGETVADFTFCPPWAPGVSGCSGSPDLGLAGPAEAAWLAVAVLFLSTRGKSSFFSPVLPSVSVFPTSVLDTLSAACGASEVAKAADSATHVGGSVGLDAHEWLRSTLLCAGNRREVPMNGQAPGGFTAVRHQLHLHGHSNTYVQRWMPVEQVLSEDRLEGCADLSPRSPRHQRSNYCSTHLVAQSPVAVVARATVTGLVEVLVGNASLRPAFKSRSSGSLKSASSSLSCSVFEEIDLVPPVTKSPFMRLSGLPSPEALAGTPLVLVRTRTLIAAVALPWCGVLSRGGAAPVDALQMANVTTVFELRTADGPGEIIGWQTLRPPPAKGGAAASTAAGLLLRIRGKSGEPAALQAMDIGALLGKAKPAPQDSKGGIQPSGGSNDSASENREEYLRHISAPVLLPKPLFGAAGTESVRPPEASAVASAVSAVQGGQLADMAARRLVLKHLTSQLPARAANVRAELADLRRSGEKLRDTAMEGEKAVKRICERQEELDAQQSRIVSALAARLELRELDGVASGDLPRLWSQLHDLRQAFELLRAAATPQRPAEAAGFLPEELVTLERLQRTWTDATAGRLRAQAEDVEAAVDAASRAAAAPGSLHGATAAAS